MQRREGSTVCMEEVGGGTVAGGRAGPAARSRSAPATCSRPLLKYRLQSIFKNC